MKNVQKRNKKPRINKKEKQALLVKTENEICLKCLKSGKENRQWCSGHKAWECCCMFSSARVSTCRVGQEEYYKEYNARPENKERVKAYQEEYYSKPENKERKKAYQEEYDARPENKEHKKEYHKEYYSKPENKEHKKKYDKGYDLG